MAEQEVGNLGRYHPGQWWEFLKKSTETLHGKEAASGTATRRASVPGCDQSSPDIPSLLSTFPPHLNPALEEEGQQSGEGGREG